jgi:hypothetical protein
VPDLAFQSLVLQHLSALRQVVTELQERVTAVDTVAAAGLPPRGRSSAVVPAGERRSGHGRQHSASTAGTHGTARGHRATCSVDVAGSASRPWSVKIAAPVTGTGNSTGTGSGFASQDTTHDAADADAELQVFDLPASASSMAPPPEAAVPHDSNGVPTTSETDARATNARSSGSSMRSVSRATGVQHTAEAAWSPEPAAVPSGIHRDDTRGAEAGGQATVDTAQADGDDGTDGSKFNRHVRPSISDAGSETEGRDSHGLDDSDSMSDGAKYGDKCVRSKSPYVAFLHFIRAAYSRRTCLRVGMSK